MGFFHNNNSGGGTSGGDSPAINDGTNRITPSDVKAIDTARLTDKAETASYYNSVAEMKADNKLIAGKRCVTLGYSLFCDMGGSTYKIVDGAFIEDGGSYHHITGTLFAQLVFAEVVNTKQFGITGLVDDSVQMLKALTFTALNKLELKLNSDVIVSTPILVNDFYHITADNKGRRIKVKDGVTMESIFKFTKNTYYVNIHGFVMDGNKASGAISKGVTYATAGANYYIATCEVCDLYMEKFADKAIDVSARCINPNIHHIYIDSCDKQGLYYLGFDGMVSHIYTSFCGIAGSTEGTYLGGGDTKISNVKTWFSGSYGSAKAGIVIASTLNQYFGIEAQENYYAGYYFDNANQNQGSLVTDRNNYGNNPITYGAVLNSGKENQLDIICRNNTNFGAIYQQTGVWIPNNDFKNNDIKISVDDLHTTFLKDDSTTEYNNIRLNRVDFRDYYHDITPNSIIVAPVTTTGLTLTPLKGNIYKLTGTATADTTFWLYGAYGTVTGFDVPINHKIIMGGSPTKISSAKATINIFTNGIDILFSGLNQLNSYLTVAKTISGISIKVLNGQTVDMIINPKILVFEH